MNLRRDEDYKMDRLVNVFDGEWFPVTESSR